MRKLSKSYTVSSRTITVNDITGFGIEDIRLIVNETKKIVIASSMQKDNITLSGTAITYVSTLAESESTDKITIEIDVNVEDIVSAGIKSAFGDDVSAGKKLISNAFTVRVTLFSIIFVLIVSLRISDTIKLYEISFKLGVPSTLNNPSAILVTTKLLIPLIGAALTDNVP